MLILQVHSLTAVETLAAGMLLTDQAVEFTMMLISLLLSCVVNVAEEEPS